MRGETARLYREMHDEGYDPNHGLRPLLVAIVVVGLIALVLIGMGLVHLLHYWHQVHPVVNHA